MNDENKNTTSKTSKKYIKISEYVKNYLDENYVDVLYKLDYNSNYDINNSNLTKLDDNHTIITLRFKNISRALLQEIVRHDHLLSPTIKSTRYTLKELKNENKFKLSKFTKEDLDKISKYIVLTGNNKVDLNNIKILNIIRDNLLQNISNDISKYNLSEAYKTEGVFTLPLSNIKNIIKLRTSKDALWEFQRLANELKTLI